MVHLSHRLPPEAQIATRATISYPRPRSHFRPPKSSPSTTRGPVSLSSVQASWVCSFWQSLIHPYWTRVAQPLTFLPAGGPTAALVAYHNPKIMVNVVDLNQDRIAAWNSAHLPIHEPGLPKIVRIARDGTSASTIDLPGLGTVSIPERTPNLTFSTRVPESIAKADIVFICVNTPTKLYGHGAGATADLSIIESAAGTIAKHAKDGAIVVEKSTVPCGTALMIRDIVRPIYPFNLMLDLAEYSC
jgi:hypothetical protein